MSKAVNNLLKAQQFAMSIRPKIGGFPYLAEILRKTEDYPAIEMNYQQSNQQRQSIVKHLLF